MELFIRMGYLYISFFIIIIFVDLGLCFNGHPNCKESKCNRHGPAVRFPFRIKNRQPDHCGYPEFGFDLSCTENKETMIQLPDSVELLVKDIDYVSQVIYTTDPQNCLPKQLSNFNLSGSSFRFLNEDSNSFVLFKCPKGSSEFLQMPCASANEYQINVFSSGISIDNVGLLYCTKMYDVLPFPSEMIDGGGNILHLTWYNPSCGFCAAQGKYCRLKANSTQFETECSGKLESIVLGLFLPVVVLLALYRLYINDKIEKEYQSKIENFLDDYKAFKPTRYSYADIKRITNQFKEELGEGAYGTVFRGKLSDEITVAVKVLNNFKGDGEEFVNEVGTIGKIHHVNVVRLVGFCADGFRRALVYEYLPNDSLDKFISSPDDKNHFLGWKKLQDIALGIARGIEYLHQGCNQRILHFDIKPHNILLDNNFNPKVSDFGLAKLCSKDQSTVPMTTARGTVGYIAPEVFSRNFGNVSYKSDVYSFGMLVLEMVAGRKVIAEGNDDQIYFPEWIYNLLEEGEDLRFEFEEEEDANIAKKLAIVGLWCIQWNPVDRPSMKIVVQMLEGGDNLSIPPNPFSSTKPMRTYARIRRRHLHREMAVISETE
ncbi:rust resistance kinase Lr10 isoform X2 [Jatropha curcas]|uniref:rust resistance kinase Lr10 isoform X2 n=1 Tax=Jatropha curcas TaxID=180498 RepID=UPI00189639F5|nr:rust resistance kinase Lr10 isoform X2 [Jatropha curcas]